MFHLFTTVNPFLPHPVSHWGNHGQITMGITPVYAYFVEQVNQMCGPQSISRSITVVTDGLLASSVLFQINIIQVREKHTILRKKEQ